MPLCMAGAAFASNIGPLGLLLGQHSPSEVCPVKKPLYVLGGYVEPLNLATCECDLIWTQGFCRRNEGVNQDEVMEGQGRPSVQPLVKG